MVENKLDYSSCHLCPRNCGVDRLAGVAGFCGESAVMRIASAVVHRGEEPPLITGKGSGTIFFTGCTLGCSFCQNSQISSYGMGAVVEPGTLGEICRSLERAGASNINLVTGSQFIPGIAAELGNLRAEGFSLPVVWNSSGFESPGGLALIGPLVDVYLLDLKSATAEGAELLFGRRDYPEAAMKTAVFAAGQRPIEFRGDALVRGTILRHLVMPGMEGETEKVIDWFGRHLADNALFSLMLQYIPPRGPDISGGPVSAEDVHRFRSERLLALLDEAGIENGFIQESEGDAAWLPDFNKWNPFPEEYAVPVWHWSCGFGNEGPENTL